MMWPMTLDLVRELMDKVVFSGVGKTVDGECHAVQDSEFYFTSVLIFKAWYRLHHLRLYKTFGIVIRRGHIHSLKY